MSSNSASNKRKKNCKHCGTAFNTNNARKVFCSENCRGLYNYHNGGSKRKSAKNQEEFICEKCGNVFKTRFGRRKYCSDRCRNISRSEALTKTEAHKLYEGEWGLESDPWESVRWEGCVGASAENCPCV